MAQKLLTIAPVLLCWPLAFGQANFQEKVVPLPFKEIETESDLRTIDHNAFKAGEKLTYVVHYGFVNAGEAVIELKESKKKIRGRKVLHAVGTGVTLGAFNWFYKVNDRYETYFDEEGVFPWMFVRRVDEGGFIINQDYTYDQHKQEVKTEKGKTFEVTPHIQDMLSSFYFARTMDFSKAKKGDVFIFDCFTDEEIFPLRMRYLGKEVVEIRSGKYRCLKFSPIVQEGRVFEEDEDLLMWLTDDGNMIPILAKAKVVVGSIKCELTSYEGLTHPISKVN